MYYSLEQFPNKGVAVPEVDKHAAVYSRFTALEQGATSYRAVFLVGVLPGVLQTPAYAARVFGQSREFSGRRSPTTAEEVVALRQTRREIVRGVADIEIILGLDVINHILRQPEEIAREQLTQLLDDVIPFGIKLVDHPAKVPSIIMLGKDSETWGYQEGVYGLIPAKLWRTGHPKLKGWQEYYPKLKRVAYDQARTVAYLETALASL